jgi:hypothetical protein
MAFSVCSPAALSARPARLAASRFAAKPAPARPRARPVRAGSGDLDRVAAIEDEISRQRAQIAEQRSSIARQRQALESVQSSVVSGAPPPRASQQPRARPPRIVRRVPGRRSQRRGPGAPRPRWRAARRMRP